MLDRILASAIEAIATGVLAWHFAAYADIRFTRRGPRTPDVP